MHKSLSDAGAYLRTHRRLRRTLIALVGVGVLLTVVLVALPLAVAAYAEGWLRDNGAAQASIDDVDINPFAGVVRVTGLSAGTEPGSRLQVGAAELDIRWWPLLSRRALVESVRLEQVRVDVVSAGDGVWRVGELSFAPPAETAAPAPETEPGESWGVGSELVDLRDVQATYRDGVFDTRVDLRALQVGSQYSWESGRETELVADLTVNGSPLVLRSDVVPWSAEPSLAGRLTLSDLDLQDFDDELRSLAGLDGVRGVLAVDLDIAGSYGSDGVLRLEISGPLNFDDGAFATSAVQASHDAVRWDGVVSLALPASAQEPLVRLDGALQLTGAAGRAADLGIDAGLEDLRWSGTLAFSPSGAGAGTPSQEPMVRVDGGLQLTGVAGRAADMDIDARLGHLRWTGDLAFSPPADDAGTVSLSGRSGLLFGDLSVAQTGVPMQLASLAEARLDGFELSGPTDLTLESLELEKLRLLGDAADAAADGQPDLATVGDLAAGGVVFDGTRLNVESLKVTEPVITVTRNEAGELERIAPLLAAYGDEEADAGAPPADETPAAEAASLVVAVAALNVTGSHWLEFRDRSVTPPADFKLTRLALDVENISTGSSDPMRVTLDAGDERTRLAVTGALAVLSGPRMADLDVQLESLDLPQFSSYIPSYDIFRGRLSSDSHVTLQGDALDVRNALQIDRLRLAGKAGEGDDVLSQGMAMPVDVALDLLRDRQDRIKLDLPVTGSLSNPTFGTGDIVRQAMQKALQNAAMSYVKNALQPLGTLMLVGNLAAKAARPRFEPVEMAAGDGALPATGREYLDKLATLLAERPGLSLTICGVATAADRQALAEQALQRLAAQTEAPAADDEAVPAAATDAAPAEPEPPQISDAQLLALASVRTSRVIAYLAEQGSVDRERLYVCRESVDDDADAPPRVEITL